MSSCRTGTETLQYGMIGPVSIDRYLEAVRRFGDNSMEVEVHSGQFHQVILTPRRAYRFPRTPSAQAGIRDRAKVLGVLSELALGIRIPTPEALIEDGELTFLVTSRIPGHAIDIDAITDTRVRDAVALQLADLLRALRTVTPRAELGVFPTADTDRWNVFAKDVREQLFPLMSVAGRYRADTELGAVTGLSVPTTALVHGDLGGENLLWEGLRLAGVVDWDEVAIGDPAEDLAALMAGYGLDITHRIVAQDGHLAALLSRAYLIRATFALQQALSAVLDGDEDELPDGLRDYR